MWRGRGECRYLMIFWRYQDIDLQHRDWQLAALLNPPPACHVSLLSSLYSPEERVLTRLVSGVAEPGATTEVTD